MKKALNRNGLVAQLSYAIQIVVMLFYPALAVAGPGDATVESGSATVTHPDANTTVVNQTTDRAVINWNGFNINLNELVQINQPGANSANLAKISGGASSILGQLVSNGRVFLVNPNGIVFGPGSHVDVAGLAATTFNIKSDDFMNGVYSFEQQSTDLKAIINQGEIHVTDNGFVVLVAPAVSNEGLIIANLGKVVLGAGNKMTLDFNGDGLVTYEVSGEVLNHVTSPDGKRMGDAVSNRGTIQANGGVVALHAQAADAVFNSLVNNQGVIEAQSLVGHEGHVSLEGSNPVANNGLTGWRNHLGEVTGAGNGKVIDEGVIDVSAIEAGANGGVVTLSGAYVGVSGAIRASGANGGNVLLSSSMRTVMTRTSSIDVSGGLAGVVKGGDVAGSVGNGGVAVVWSDDTTRFFGTIFGRGGAVGGNGGNAEVSGHNRLGFHGGVNLLAPNGTVGTLLLDPRNGTVDDGAEVTALTDIDSFLDPGGVGAPVPDEAIDVDTLNAAAANVTIQVSQDFTVANMDLSGKDVSLTNAGVTLTIQAGRSVFLNDNVITNAAAISITANDTLASGVVDLDRGAGAAVITMAAGKSITSGGFNITVTLSTGAGLTNSTSGDITLAGINAGAGNVLVVNNGPTAGSDILRVDATELIAGASVALDVNGAGLGGAIGSLAAPIRTDTANLELRSQSGGAFVADTVGALDLGTAALGGLTGVTVSGGGNLNVIAVGAITDSEDISVGGNATFSNAGTAAITLGENVAETTNFGTLTFFGSDVTISENSSLDLVGTNAATGFAMLTSEGASISDGAVGTDLSVLGLATLTAFTSIDVGGGAGEDTFFASLTFVAGTSATISENDDMLLAGASSTGAGGAATLTSETGSISDDASGADISVGGLATLTAATFIDVGGGAGEDTFFGTLTFTAATTATISENDSMDLVGFSSAASAALTSETASISDGAVVGGTDITVTGLATLTAATSIDVGGGAGEDTFFGTLTFVSTAGGTTISENNSMDLVGTNSAGTFATLTSETSSISDGAVGTDIAVGTLATLTASTTITLGGDAGEVTNFGTLLFTGTTVTIQEDSDMGLANGSVAAASALLTATGAISDAGADGNAVGVGNGAYVSGANENVTTPLLFMNATAGAIGTVADAIEARPSALAGGILRLEASATAGVFVRDTDGVLRLQAWTLPSDGVAVNSSVAGDILISAVSESTTLADIAVLNVINNVTTAAGNLRLEVCPGAAGTPNNDIYVGDGVGSGSDGIAVLVSATGGAVTLSAEDDVIVQQDATVTDPPAAGGSINAGTDPACPDLDGFGGVVIVGTVDADIATSGVGILDINDPIIATTNVTITAAAIQFTQTDGFIQSTGTVTLNAVGSAAPPISGFILEVGADANLEIDAPTIVLNATGGTGFGTNAIDLDVATTTLSAVVSSTIAGAVSGDGSGDINIDETAAGAVVDLTAGFTIRREDTQNGNITDTSTGTITVDFPTAVNPTRGITAGSGTPLLNGNGNVTITSTLGDIQMGDAAGFTALAIPEIRAIGDNVVLSAVTGAIRDLDDSGFDGANNHVNIQASTLNAISLSGVGIGGNSLLEVSLRDITVAVIHPDAPDAGRLDFQFETGGAFFKNFATSGLLLTNLGGAVNGGDQTPLVGAASERIVVLNQDAALIIGMDTFNAANIQKDNAESAAAADDDIIVDPDIEVVSTAGAVILRAGDNVLLRSGANAVGATSTVLVSGFNDNDLLGNVTAEVTAGANSTFVGFVAAAESPTAADITSDTLSITSLHNITFTDTVAGAVTSSLNTDVGAATLTAGNTVTGSLGTIQLAGVNAVTLNAQAVGTITDLATGGTSIAVAGVATFLATDAFGTRFGVTLGDGGTDVVNFGSLNVTGAAVSITEDSAMTATSITATGAVSLTADDGVGATAEGIALGSISAPAQAVTLTATGNITDANDSDTNVTAASLTIAAGAAGATGFGNNGVTTDTIETKVSTVSTTGGAGGLANGFFMKNTGNLTIAGVTATGDINIEAASDITITAAVTSAGAVTLISSGDILTTLATTAVSAGTSATLIAGGGDGDIGSGAFPILTTAASLVLRASGSGDVFVTESNDVTVDASSATGNITLALSGAGNMTVNAISTAGAVSLATTNGTIADGNGGTTNVTAGSLTATAAGADAVADTIDLDTDVDTLTVSTTGAFLGTNDSIAIDNLGDVNVTSATTAIGTITINVTAGNLTATTVTSGSGGGVGGAVTLTTATSGDINLGVVTAVTSTTLTAAGAIRNTTGAVANVIGASLSASSVSGIDLNTDITTLTSATVSGAGSIDVDETSGLAVTLATTTNGNIRLAAGGLLTLTSVDAGSTAGAGVVGDGNITASTTVGNISVGLIRALGDTVSLNAAAAIVDGNGDVAAGNVVAGKFAAIGATGVGDEAGAGGVNALETNVRFFEATAGTGGIALSNLGALTVGDIGAVAAVTATEDITIVTASPLTIDISMSTLAATLTLTAGESATANADNLTINAGVLVSTGANFILSAGDNVNILGTLSGVTSSSITAGVVADADGGSITSSNGLGLVTLTAGAGAILTVAAAGNNRDLGIDLDANVQVADLDVTGTTTGGIEFTNTRTTSLATLTSVDADTAATTGNGSITLSNTGSALTVTTPTTVATTGNGDITVLESGGPLTVTTLSASVTTLTTGTADVLISGAGGLTTVGTAAAGDGETIVTPGTTTSGSATMTIESTGGLTVTTSLTTNTASGDADLAVDVTGGATTIPTATTNATTTGSATIDINTDGGTLVLGGVGTGIASNVGSGSGEINLKGAGGAVTVTTATATATAGGDVDINISATGTVAAPGFLLTAGTITSVGTDGDIALTTTGSGNMTIGLLTAAGDRVTLDSTGDVTDTDAAAGNDVLAAELVAVTDDGFGTAGSAGTIETAVSNVAGTGGTGGFFQDNTSGTTLTVTSLVGTNGVDATGVTATGDIIIRVTDFNDLNVAPFASQVRSTTGNITLLAGNDIGLEGLVIAEVGNVSLSAGFTTAGAANASGSIFDNNGTGVLNVSGTLLTAVAVGNDPDANGLAIDLDTAVTTLTAATVGVAGGAVETGGIRVEDTEFGMTVTLASTQSGSITLSATGGDLTLNGAVGVTAGLAGIAGDGNIILSTFTGNGLSGPATSGNINLGTAVATPGTLTALLDKVELNSVGAVLDGQVGEVGNGTNNLSAFQLVVRAVNGFGTAANRVETTLAGAAGAPGVVAAEFDQVGFFQLNTGALTIGNVTTVGGTVVSGIQETDLTNDGLVVAALPAISVTALSPLNVTANVLTTGAITLTADEAAAPNAPPSVDNLHVFGGVTVQSTQSSVTLNAGDDVITDVGSFVIAATNLTIRAGFSDAITGRPENDATGAAILLGAQSSGNTTFVSAINNIVLGGFTAANGLNLFTSLGNILDGNGDALNVQANGVSTFTALVGVVGLPNDAIEVIIQNGQLIVNAGAAVDRVSVSISGQIDPDGRLFTANGDTPGLILFNNIVQGGEGVDNATDRFHAYTSDLNAQLTSEPDHGWPGFQTHLMLYLNDGEFHPEDLYKWDASMDMGGGAH